MAISGFSGGVPIMDFGTLGDLGKTYKEAQSQRMLSDLGKGLADGSLDYRQAAGVAAEAGRLDLGLSLLKLGEEKAAQRDFQTNFGSLLGGGAQPQPMAPPSGAPPAGHYEPAPQPPKMAQAPTAAQPSPRTNPVQNNIPALMYIMSHPGASAGQKKMAEIALTEAIKSPDNLKEYDFYQRQSLSRGEQPLPLLDWTIKIKQAGATAITNDMRGEGAEAKKLGEGAGERANTMMAAASSASKRLGDINRSEALLGQLAQGKLQPARMNVAAWAKAFGLPDGAAESIGLDPKSVGTAQALQALTAKSVVSMIGQGGFPANNFSDADRQFLVSTVERLSNEPQANKIILETGRRIAQLDIERAKQWQAFHRNPQNKGKGFADFEIEWNDKIAKADLFGDLRKEAEALAPERTPAAAVSDGWRDLGNGVRMRMKQP